MLKDKIKIDKSSKIILMVLFMYLILVLIIFLPNYIKKQREKLYIYSNNYQIKYEFGEWKKIVTNEEEKNKLFEVYDDNKYIGKYSLFSDKKIYLYNKGEDSNYESIDYSGHLLAFNGTISLDVVDYKKLSMTEVDNVIINEALGTVNVSNISDFSTFEKFELDIDRDGQLEYIYNISNFYNEKSEQKVSLLFIYDNHKIKVIEKSVTDNDGIYSDPSYSILDIIDIKSDNRYELIYFENYYSKPDESCLKIYDLKKFKEINNFCK